jgi:hypothetical protein
MMAEGVLPPTVTSVTAKLKTEQGTASAHMAIYTMPTTTTAQQDNASVEQEELTGIGVTESTLTLTCPTDVIPTPYVLRLWVDNLTGLESETTDRDIDSPTSTTDEAPIPTGVSITSITVTE